MGVLRKTKTVLTKITLSKNARQESNHLRSLMKSGKFAIKIPTRKNPRKNSRRLFHNKRNL